MKHLLACLSLVPVVLPACASERAPAASGSGDAAFTRLANQILQDDFRRHPSAATDLGIHPYDSNLENLSRTARLAESAALKRFREQLAAIDPATLGFARQLDREQLLHAMDSGILYLDVIRGWMRDPDSYSGSITNAAYTIMK